MRAHFAQLCICFVCTTIYSFNNKISQTTAECLPVFIVRQHAMHAEHDVLANSLNHLVGA